MYDKEKQDKWKLLRFVLFFVGLLGFEPRKTESKSVVLPLHHNPIVIWSAKIRFWAFSAKWFLIYLPENEEKNQCDEDVADNIDGIVGTPTPSFNFLSSG